MSYEDWRPRRSQSRSIKTAIRKLRTAVRKLRRANAPAHWVTTVEPCDRNVALTLGEIKALAGRLTYNSCQMTKSVNPPRHSQTENTSS